MKLNFHKCSSNNFLFYMKQITMQNIYRFTCLEKSSYVFKRRYNIFNINVPSDVIIVKRSLKWRAIKFTYFLFLAEGDFLKFWRIILRSSNKFTRKFIKLLNEIKLTKN